MPKIYIASDHAGFELKATLAADLAMLGYEIEDLGAHEISPDDDYPDFILPCAERVAEENQPGIPARVFGILLGGSGQGEAMAANRVPGARAAAFYGGPLELVRKTREHNDANILSLGARFVSAAEAAEAVKVFLGTPFSDAPRHIRRLAKF